MRYTYICVDENCEYDIQMIILSFSNESASSRSHPFTNSARENSNGTLACNFQANIKETISNGSTFKHSKSACIPSGPILSSVVKHEHKKQEG